MIKIKPRNSRLNKFALAISIGIPILMMLSYLFAPNDPLEANVLNKFASSSMEYPLGTDQLGRCILSRLLYGGQVTIGITLFASAIVFFLGTFFGILFSFFRGITLTVLKSILNAITAIPPIVYLLVLVGVMGNSISTMIIALVFSTIFRLIKIAMSHSEEEQSLAYIKCAVASGASKFRLASIHILPNIVISIIQSLCLTCSEMIAAIAGFSFIGISLGNEVVDWGTMIDEGLNYLNREPMLVVWPVIFVLIASLCFNTIAKVLLERRQGN